MKCVRLHRFCGWVWCIVITIIIIINAERLGCRKQSYTNIWCRIHAVHVLGIGVYSAMYIVYIISSFQFDYSDYFARDSGGPAELSSFCGLVVVAMLQHPLREVITTHIIIRTPCNNIHSNVITHIRLLLLHSSSLYTYKRTNYSVNEPLPLPQTHFAPSNVVVLSVQFGRSHTRKHVMPAWQYYIQHTSIYLPVTAHLCTVNMPL
jgi:hypothetical protein